MKKNPFLVSHEYQYHPDVDEDDKIVGKILTRREALAIGSLSVVATLLGCGGGGTSSTGGSTTGAPTITSQPSSLTVATGSIATFSVVAAGASLTYQWYKGGVAITDATSSSYVIASAASTDEGPYHVIVTNTLGNVTSNDATLTVSSGIDLVATPEVTEGPFFVDEGLLRSDLVSGTSRSTVVNGYPLALTFTLYNLSGGAAVPLQGAHIDIWHADTIGTYSDESSGSIQSESTKGQTWLRGYQVTDASGQVKFETIHPGWYTGRTPHIHVKIRTYNASNNLTHEFTTQVFFTDTLNASILSGSIYQHGTRTVFNTNDNIYSVKQSDGTMVGTDLMLNMSSDSAGESGTFSLAFLLG